MFNSKPARGIQFLVAQKIIEDNPSKRKNTRSLNRYLFNLFFRLVISDAIAKFMFENESMSKKKIGELLSESDASSQDLTSAFLRQLDFAAIDFDAAVRLFLSKFMLPGACARRERERVCVCVCVCDNVCHAFVHLRFVFGFDCFYIIR